MVQWAHLLKLYGWMISGKEQNQVQLWDGGVQAWLESGLMVGEGETAVNP